MQSRLVWERQNTIKATLLSQYCIPGVNRTALWLIQYGQSRRRRLLDFHTWQVKRFFRINTGLPPATLTRHTYHDEILRGTTKTYYIFCIVLQTFVVVTTTCVSADRARFFSTAREQLSVPGFFILEYFRCDLPRHVIKYIKETIKRM